VQCRAAWAPIYRAVDITSDCLARGVSRSNDHAALQLDYRRSVGAAYELAPSPPPQPLRRCFMSLQQAAVGRYGHLAVLVGLSDETL